MGASIYDRPDLYDLAAPADPEMERFYVDLAGERGGHVLELACGTGRFSLALAKAGLAVTGGDLSPRMLAAARAAASVAAVAIDYAELDMRDFELGTRFDTIIVAASSMMHLHTEADFRGFFGSVRRHLAPGGRLGFDVFVPSAEILARPGSERHEMGRFVHEDGPVTLEETVRYDPITQLSHIEWLWSRPGAPDFWRAPLVLRQLYPQELPILLEVNGLRLAERYGGFDRSQFVNGSQRQVCVCVAA